MASTSDKSIVGAWVGGVSGAVTGVKIALGVTVATGGLPGAIVAPQIVLTCAGVGAYLGYESGKAAAGAGMSAAGTVADWIRHAAGN